MTALQRQVRAGHGSFSLKMEFLFQRFRHFFAWLDARLAENEFVCGPNFSVADITGLVTVDFCSWAKLKPAEQLSHSRRWHATVSQRPSAKA
jgi:glutathione S-transferase